MATTPNEYTLKGKLQIVFDGLDGTIELGEVTVPIRLDFQRPGKQGPVYRGSPLRGFDDVLPCSEGVTGPTVES